MSIVIEGMVIEKNHRFKEQQLFKRIAEKDAEITRLNGVIESQQSLINDLQGKLFVKKERISRKEIIKRKEENKKRRARDRLKRLGFVVGKRRGKYSETDQSTERV